MNSRFASQGATLYQTLPEALLSAPPQEAFVTFWESEDDTRSVSFGEMVNLVLAQAAWLREQGLRAGDTVILIMPQSIPLMASFIAAMYLGAVPAILAYPNFKVEPAKYRSGLAGVSTNLKARLVVLDSGFPEGLIEHVVVGDGARLVRYSELAATPFCITPEAGSHPEGVAFIQHSAGTTGLQKGVALSHEAVLRHLARLIGVLRLEPGDRIYSWLPLYHDMGLIACFMLPMVAHVPVVMQSPTSWVMQPATMLRLIADYRCTLSWLPNFSFQFLARRVDREERAAFDLSCVRALINCSEPVRASSMDEFLDAFSACGVRSEMLQASYAMAETVFAVTQTKLYDHELPCRVWVNSEVLRKQHRAVPVSADDPAAVCYVSSGQCLPQTQVRIVSAKGQHLPDGDVGEIIIHSDAMLNGYYNRPDLTDQALKEGWYWSGDLGFVWDGEVYVVGRKKDLIIVAGENIYPHDIEEIVSSHPAIHDGRVVAFGLYNPRLGTEDIVVVAELRGKVIPENTFPIEQELRNSIVGALGVVPRHILLKPANWVVKSTAGKPARSATREKALSENKELQEYKQEPALQ
ncbi:MAG TPA: AMP-binding protein [Terriglobales bacterium]|nr:AMP-binding protein [Terriglobales bacterium]